jgi:alanyl-tRNA synthetase
METLAPANPSVREFEATVERVEGREVVLDATYFYAESGGQPADRGTIAGVPVVDVQAADDAVAHTLAEPPWFEAGEPVACAVDDEFRTYCARAHTASHVLYGAGRRLLDGLGYGGFDIGEDRVRVDLSTPTDIDDEALVALERLTNQAVWDSRPVSWETVPVEEARARSDVAFNAQTEEGVMAGAETVRLVTVADWDVAACGGTHVANTREIGPVALLDRSNPGEGLTRVELAVGGAGIDHRATVHRAARRAGRALGAGVADVGEAAEAAVADRSDLESAVRSLRSRLLAEYITGFERHRRDGAAWRVGLVEEFGPNDVADPAKEAAGEAGAVVAVAGATERSFLVVASDGRVDAGDVVDAVTDEFGGGGGGGPTFAQAGGIDAPPERLVAFLR